MELRPLLRLTDLCIYFIFRLAQSDKTEKNNKERDFFFYLFEIFHFVLFGILPNICRICICIVY